MAKYGSKEYQEDLLNSVPKYLDSEETLAAKDKVTEYEGKVPTEGYKGTYQDRIAQEISSYLGRDKFNYNPNNDATYQQLRSTYLDNAKKGMQDTLGSAAMLSGGNNNSAAQVASQQVYNDYAGRVTDIIPTLEAQAYSRHRAELSDKLNDIGLLQGLDEQEYTRHQDEINKTMALLDYYSGKYQGSVAKDQAQYGNDLAIWGQQLSAGQNQYQYEDTAKRSDAEVLRGNGWQKLGSLVMPSKEELTAMNMTEKQAKEMISYIKSQSVSKGGGSGNSGGKNSEYSDGKYNNVTYTNTQLKNMESNGDFAGLFDYLSEKSSSLSNLYTQGKKYGLSESAIDYYLSAGREGGDGKPIITTLDQANELLKSYGWKKDVNTAGLLTEDEFYLPSNNSKYNSYAEYLTDMVGRYLNL